MFTIDSAKTMLRGILREMPDKFYAAIFTIARDGIEDVTREELPATIAAIATEVRCESLAAGVKMLNQRLNALAKRYLAFEESAKAAPVPSGDAGGSDESEAPSAVGGDAAYVGPPADAEEEAVRALFASATPSGQSESARAGAAPSALESAPQGPRATIVPRGAAAPKALPKNGGVGGVGGSGAKKDGANAAPAARPEPNVPITVPASETK